MLLLLLISSNFIINFLNSDTNFFINSVAPKIDRTHLKALTIRSGHAVRLEIDVKGEPIPTISWTVGGKALPERVKITMEPYKTTFIIAKAVRKDTNNYVITATNSNGTDEATLELKVLGMYYFVLVMA